VAAQADTVILTNINPNWYDSSGFHHPTNMNYIAGENDGGYRNSSPLMWRPAQPLWSDSSATGW